MDAEHGADGSGGVGRGLAFRFAGFYFVYFATLGAILPYWSLYLQSLGMAALQIGVLVGAIQITKIFAPNVWGPLADRTGRRLSVARFTALGTILAFLPLYGLDTFWAMLPVVAVFAFFHAGPLPLVEGAVWDVVRSRGAHYGRLRLWGSVGFILTAVALGPLLDYLGYVRLLDFLSALLVGILLFTLLVPEPGSAENDASGSGSLLDTLRRRRVWGFFATTFLMQASHGAYYGFFSIYMSGHGYSGLAIGLLWGLGVAAEVGVFLYTDQLVRRFGVRFILAGSLVLATVRWALIGSTNALAWLLAAQTLHAATFATFHAAAAHHTHELFPGNQRSSGFALYSSLAFGFGGGVGSLLSGGLWDEIGGGATFWVASGMAAAGVAVMFLTRVAAPRREAA
ncbi:MFS transporter [Thiohalorhabdus methylotrophus]|uniref:MFS transporter n=1 Tax=Thiohalorhabdus methylotrophus TaxID=3242694 RepID=A0ABV4TUT3_9GAMM